MTELSDDQIDKLLSEAESRLAARGTGKSALVPHQGAAVLAVSETAATPAQAAPDQAKQAKELSVLVPKPVIKEKKVSSNTFFGCCPHSLPR